MFPSAEFRAPAEEKLARISSHFGSAQLAASNARRSGPLWDARPNGGNLPRLSPADSLRSASATTNRACLPRLARRAHRRGCSPGSLIGAKTDILALNLRIRHGQDKNKPQ